MLRKVLLALFLAGSAGSGSGAQSVLGSAEPPEIVVRQLEHLAPRRANPVNVYAILIAGDAGEDVFEREVKTVDKQLEKSLDVSGHVVTLINNRRLPQPEATLRSIRYAIQGVSRSMNKSQDLLFMHITSHGSRDHFLVLSHPAQELRWLDAKSLAAMLEESGIRHRFIVISGCYTGGFIPGLANENTVVVTAAAATVTSYGCGNDSEITDFSRAFYAKALPKSKSLPDAARAVPQFIHEDEARAGRQHSYPQASIGYLMDEYLQKIELNANFKVRRESQLPAH